MNILIIFILIKNPEIKNSVDKKFWSKFVAKNPKEGTKWASTKG